LSRRVQLDDGLQDIFVHMSAFRVAADAYWVKEGDAVEFGAEQTPKGPRALDVVVVNSAS
jgi:cold shock CspA family protein